AFDAETAYGRKPAGTYPAARAAAAGSSLPTDKYSALQYDQVDAGADFGGGGFEPLPTTEFSAVDFGSARPTDIFDPQDFDAEPVFDLGEFAVDFELPGDQRPTQDLSGARTRETASEFDEQTRTGHALTVDTNVDLLDGRIVGAS